MARIRTIKPEFWTDEDLSELSAETHMFAAALLNHCDDEGFFKANPKLLQAQIFPLRELSGTVPVLVQSLKKVGYLRLFDGSDGKKYGQVINFTKHQTINKAKPSKIRDLEVIPDEYGTDTVGVPLGKERKGKERNTTSTTTEGGGNFENSEDDSSKPKEKKSHPVYDWEPSQEILKELKRFKVPDEFAEQSLPEFRAYWSSREQITSYDSKFYSTMLSSWKRLGHNWTPDQKHSGSTNLGPSDFPMPFDEDEEDAA